MHPQHAIDALFALCEESFSQESSENSTEPDCTSPPRMTKGIQDTKLTPTKFTLSGVKRKTSDYLELIYETSSKKIRLYMYRSRRASRNLYSIAVATPWLRLHWKNTYV